MKVVVPILRNDPCGCSLDSFLIHIDAFGVTTGVECPLHGDPFVLDKLEFDSEEEWEKWKQENKE